MHRRPHDRRDRTCESCGKVIFRSAAHAARAIEESHAIAAPGARVPIRYYFDRSCFHWAVTSQPEAPFIPHRD